MTTAEPASYQERAAGWMKDPSGRHFGRYWDGQKWTDHVISATTVPSTDPVDRRGSEPERAAMPEGLGSWKPDPSGRHVSRYWDGGRWTEHVMSAERVPSIDPFPAPAAARTKILPAPGLWAWARSAPWAVAVIICGFIVIGVALSTRSPGSTQGGTNVTDSVVTTAPSAGAPQGTTTPLAAQPTLTAPGVPATTPPTLQNSQSPATSAPAVDPPPSRPQPGGSTTDPSMSTTL